MSARLTALEVAEALGQPPPTPEQQDVVEADLEPTLVVAGAGSGKTETMASRVVWLIANGLVAPQDVLGLTFTRKAALELAARVTGKLAQLHAAGIWEPGEEGQGEGFDLPTVSTYHAYAGRLVSEHGLRLGVEPDAHLLSEAASWQLAHDVVHRYAGDLDELDYAPSTLVGAVLHLAGELGEHLVDTAQVADWLEQVAQRTAQLGGRDGAKPLAVGARTSRTLRVQALVPPIVEAYRAAKRVRGVLDFGDQMALAARLARDVPEVGQSDRARYQAVLLDEFQDTSEAQMVLLASLFAGQRRPVTAVGDPHQSIYAWRGASATTLSRFAREFSLAGPSVPVLPLSTSWRNDAAVLAAANAVAEPLQRRSPVPVQTLRPRAGAGQGQIEVARLVDHVAEADHVAAWIAARRPTPGTTAAVLCRTRAQFPPVVDALRRRGLPVEVVGLGGLLDAPEVLDLVALLWAAQEPTRGDQVMRLLTGPVCRLGAADVDALWGWAEELARDPGPGQRLPGGARADLGSEGGAVLAEAVDQPPPERWVGRRGQHLSAEGAGRVAWLSGVVRRVRSLVGLPLPDLVGEAERLLGLDLEVAADPDLHPTWGRAQLDAMVDVAAGYAATAERASLGGFLDWLDAAREHERGLEGADVPELAAVSVDERAVQVLTVHAAKGLEWDAVAVPGLVEGVFPSSRGRRAKVVDGAWVIDEPKDAGWLTGIGHLPTPLRGDREGRPTVPWASLADTHELRDRLEDHAVAGGQFSVQEERRLAYVAFTRARHSMLLTASVWTTGSAPRVTSRFLEEVRSVPGLTVCQPVWAPMPDPADPEQCRNPRSVIDTTAAWPRELDARRRAVLEVGSALVAARGARPRPPRHTDRPEDPWSDEIALLLAERREQRERSSAPPWPDHLSTSAVVELVADADAFRRRLRRPMPQPPAPHARLGTAFHAWVEQHYAAASLVDLDEVVGDQAEQAPADDLAQLQEAFLASEWADRTPLEIEVSLETQVAGRTVRGRIDAVFEGPDGRRTVVDWKTGSPGTPAQQRVRAVQLAVYRVAYARLAGLRPEDVDAAFFYAATGTTVHPDLPAEQDLEGLLAELLEEGLQRPSEVPGPLSASSVSDGMP